MSKEEEIKAKRKAYYLKNREKWKTEYYGKHREKKIEQAKAWAIANREKHNAYGKKAYHLNLDKAREMGRIRTKKYTAKNRNIINARIKKRRAENPEKARATWRQENRNRYLKDPEKIRARNKQWDKDNPEKARERQRSAKHRRRALERANTIKNFTKKEWLDKINLYQNRCAYCDIGLYEHMDHVIPLSRGGAHSLDNIVPACQRCNLKKGTQIWTPRQPVTIS